MVTMGAPTKPMRVNERNRQYNKKYKSEMKTRIKTVRYARSWLTFDSARDITYPACKFACCGIHVERNSHVVLQL